MNPFEHYSIAAGYNVVLGSLVNIESIVATGDRDPFYGPQAYGHATPGARRGRLTGVGYRAGFAKVVWHLPVATFNQYEYLRDTILAGVLSGPTTIYSTVGKLSYARYNAVLDIPATEEQPGSDFFAFKQGLDLTFTRLVAL